MSQWIGLKILEQWHIIIVIIIICCNIVFNCIIIVCSDMLSKRSELVLILWVENCYWLIFIVIIFIIPSVSALPDECDIIVIFYYLFFLEKTSSGEYCTLFVVVKNPRGISGVTQPVSLSEEALLF